MENSIEEDIKNAEHFIKSIKKDKEYKEENGWHGYYNKEIVELARILEHILSDYKRVLKENKELQEDRNKFKKALGKRITYCNELEKDLFENGSNYVIPKQKVKDKIEELKQERDETYTKFLGGNRTDENLSTRGKMIEGGIKVLQELLEESEE